MNARLALLAAAASGLLLTGCPLTDDYKIVSDKLPEAGADSGGKVNTAGATQAGGDTSEGGNASMAGAPDEVGGASAGSGGMSLLGGSGGMVSEGGSSGSGGSGGSIVIDPCNDTCSTAQTCCIDKCVDTKTDAPNCGACGHSCTAGRTCAGSVCSSGWLSMGGPPTGFVGRSKAAAVAMGGSMFIWGGMNFGNDALADGAIYNPKDNTWKVLPAATGSPSARVLASAVWTGKVVIVFGGADAGGNTSYRDGAIYDPKADSWTALNPPSTVTRRTAPYAFWDGSSAIFWGGTVANGGGWTSSGNGERFDLTSWSTLSTQTDPGALAYPSVGFDGSLMYLSGGVVGNNRQDKSFSYDITNNKWTALGGGGPMGGPSSRSTGFGAWDGSRFVVWGGRDDAGLRNDGKYFAGNSWTAMSAAGAPSARMIAYRRSGWAFQVKPGVVAIMGGQSSLFGQGTLATNGAIYDVAKAQWTGIPDWPTQEAHDSGSAVWTGEEFIVWGGRNWNGASNSGQRWAP